MDIAVAIPDSHVPHHINTMGNYTSEEYRYMDKEIDIPINEESCPACGSPTTHREGCLSCINPSCGWGKCG